MILTRPLTVIAALATIIVISSAALAQEDCPRGDLDKIYCDKNGDLTADLPTDPKKIINPSALIFAYLGMSWWEKRRARQADQSSSAAISSGDQT